MTYNFSSYPHMDPCISARAACITDPRYHHNFDPRCHNRFDSRHDGLELNIQLPEFDLNIPPCPACPPCPPVPACPPYPQVKPEPESKIIVDFSKLAITVNPITDDILDIETKEPTGYKFKECAKIIQNSKNNLQVIDGKLVGNCEDNSACDKCVEVINSSILDAKSAEAFFSTHNMSVLEGTVHII
ncbi:hypothetical protein [Wolbachia endosymbiont (group A) of Clivina fossor]|uniref:hypothetical protein n=1 Tax=Wolbachia endosymbiont (group A) of Clivina fossor TaxID=3066133 RepID=UPI003132AE76